MSFRFGTELVAITLFLSLSFRARALETPHLDLEMTAAEYQALLAQREEIGRDELNDSLTMGKRFLDWLRFINDHRAPGTQISLTTPATQVGYPIDQPSSNSPRLVKEAYDRLQTTLPDWFKTILFAGGAFISDLPISDAEFIRLGVPVNFNYERAARWTLQVPYLNQYASRKREDVRGYYFLSRDAELAQKWAAWSTLANDTKATILTWLNGICLNGFISAQCTRQINEAKDDGARLEALYRIYEPKGRSKWNSYFNLQNPRHDVEWTAPLTMNVPFIQPTTAAVENFLRVNIEDEWKWQSWGLKLKFGTGSFSTPRIVFEPGATPHVEGLGGNTITMDANAPLTEYGVQWTIRHEFGHVLEFPDCYVEFYDSSVEQMIQYQLDTTNLMCSRRGKLQEKHFDALRAAYFRPQR